jgi:hypothetical protein
MHILINIFGREGAFCIPKNVYKEKHISTQSVIAVALSLQKMEFGAL